LLNISKIQYILRDFLCIKVYLSIIYKLDHIKLS
jgi:hypothetical protein